MLTLLISLLVAAACSYASIANHLGRVGTVVYGMAGFVASMLLIGYLVRKKSTAVQEELQGLIEGDQKRINRMLHQFQSKPGRDPAQMQRKLDAEQKVMLEKSLDFTEKFEPLKKWNFLMGRQIATMRLQFQYQLKAFKQVDELLATRTLVTGPMLTEPVLVAMKMARHYENKEFKAAEKTFKWHVRWCRGERGTLLYGLMSWIHMKNGDAEKARQVLLKGKKVTGNGVLSRNCDLLTNCNEKKFSNAGLGEEWYALYLENPLAPKQKRMRGKAQGKGRF